MPAKQTFGRRGTLPGPGKAPHPSAPMPPGLSPAVQALLPEPAPGGWRAEDEPRVVPASLRATLLAGLVVGLVQAGLATRAPDAPGVLTVALGAAPGAALPVALASGLLDGARAAFGTLAVVRWLLNRLGRSGPIDYAAGAAGLAVAYAFAAHLVGLGGIDPSLPFDVALSAVAGLLYRLFAGTRPGLPTE